MPGAADHSISIPTSLPAPSDINSYSRFMHDHTKRQMQAQGAFPPEHTSGSSSHGRKGANSTSSSMTNGTSPDA